MVYGSIGYLIFYNGKKRGEGHVEKKQINQASMNPLLLR
jgi:hypothetical protein